MKGLDKVLKNLQKIEKESMKSVGKGLMDSLEKMAEESLFECPLDEGPLRESMLITVNNTAVGKGNKNATVTRIAPIATKEKYEAHISYDTPYAVVQHENPNFRHPTPGTKWKYLEDPFNRNANNVEKEIENRLKRVIK